MTYRIVDRHNWSAPDTGSQPTAVAIIAATIESMLVPRANSLANRNE
jgi:hypothetical protein